MAGLQSLMPGQAVPPQMTAPKSAATPAAEVGQYEGMSLEELIAAYMRKPSGVLLGLIDKADKARKLNEAQQGQQALAQMQQQQGTVADEKLAQVLQGAGGIRRMATGGIVALGGGGSSFVPGELLVNPDYDKNGNPRSSTERDTIIRQNAERIRAARAAQEGTDKNFFERLGPDEPLRRIYDYFSTPSEKRVPIADALTTFFTQPAPSAAPAAAAPTAQPSTPGPRTRPQGEGVAPAAEPAPTPSPRRPTRENDGKPPAAAPAAAPAVNPIAQAFQALLATQPPQGVSPEIQAQREKVTGLQALQEQQALEDAKRIREEVVRTGQRRMGRANTPFIEDAQALAALAGAIDPRKGYTFGSLGTGIASALSEREARKQKAEEYVAAGSDKVRQLNATYLQLQLEQAKYQEAQLAGDAKAARESAEKIAALRYKYETDKADLEIKQNVAKAQIAAAGKPPGEVALMEWLRSPENRKIYEDVQSSKREDDRLVKLYEIYNKNKLTLGDITFDQFVAGFKQAAGAASSDVPPPGAVRPKGAP